jgi:hypothetical protein
VTQRHWTQAGRVVETNTRRRTARPEGDIMARPPRGFKVRLKPQDEFPHVPDAAANYNESMYFNMFDPAQKVGAAGST